MFIIDPRTLKKVKIQSNQGLSLLKSYVKYFQNGGSEQTDMSKITAGLPGVAPKRDEPPGLTGSDEIITVDSPENSEQEQEENYIKQIKDKYLKDTEKNEFIVIKSKLSGTLMFMAPEALTEKTHSLNTDIWSLGVVFFKLLTGRNFINLLDVINKKSEDVLKKPTLLSLPYMVSLINNKDIVENSTTKFNLFLEEHKEYLSKENLNKLKGIFEILKKMIKFEPKERIDIDEVVNELKRITDIKETNNVTIPFDESKIDEIKGRIENSDIIDKVENYFEIATEKISVYKFGNNNEQDKIFNLKDKTREKCNSKNSCIIAKNDKNINEVLLHRYLSEKDNEHKFIVDFYKYDIHSDDIFIYMEHTPQSLLEYWETNLNIRDLSKYYVKSYRRQKSQKLNQIGTQKELEKQQQKQRELYERYKESKGVELGGKGCKRHTNRCKLQGDKSGQGITCKLYGTKHKCKTSNEELAKKVKQEIDNKIFEEIFIIILKAAEALQFFHQHNILHGDIKLGNIVIQKKEIDNENKYSVKFIDVGESNILLNEQTYKLEFQEEEQKAETEKVEDNFDWSDDDMFQ